MTDIIDELRSINEERQNAEPWTCEQIAKRGADEIERLRAQVERLREALREIATGRDADGLISDFPMDIAAEALAETKKDPPSR